MADDLTVESTNETPAEAARATKRTTKKAAAPRKSATKKAGSAQPAAEPTAAATADAVGEPPAKKTAAKKTAAKKTAAKKATAKKSAAKKVTAGEPAATESAAKTTATKTATKRASKRAAAPADETLPLGDAGDQAATPAAGDMESAEAPTVKKATARKTAAKKSAASKTAASKTAAKTADAEAPAKKTTARKSASKKSAATDEQAAIELAAGSDEGAAQAGAPAVLFQTPEPTPAPRRRTRKTAAAPEPATDEPVAADEVTEETEEEATDAAEVEAATAEGAESEEETEEQESEDGAPARRRRRRGGRRRRKSGGNGDDSAETDDDETESTEDSDAADEAEGAADGGSSRRRRRRRRAGENAGDSGDDPENTVTRVRDSKPLEQQITAVSGSTRLEAKKQRRREGREAGRRRAPIVSEAEFLARRESVDRVMVVRQRQDLTQIGVLEDKVLVEHYVARESQTSLIGNIYLGRVQNVLPSMEAAFIDIGKGRNAVLYAGEVNWAALGHKDGQPRKIESVLSSGQTVLVQVTKDPIGHKGARLTSQISLAGRFLVYVPDGTTSGISRKLPDNERNRLKTLLKEIVPDTAGVIVRTAAEGASEEELTRDVERLKARWNDIEAKAKGSAPQLLYGEPDLTLKVVRDLFTEDFAKLVVQGQDAWETVKGYVDHVAPDLSDRVEQYDANESGKDLFAAYRVDEQIAKGLDRKVWLPSGGSLIIDRTEAMTVVDVNTGKFTGSGGNLEETVTKNNLEAAEEIVRQLRLRDIGGIIVVDFIDMVLESNRDLVLRRLVECLGRDRTRHQVAEVTSLGLVQMTRKRIGTGLVEAFSETCSHCQGRGIVIHDHPVESGGSGVAAPEESGGRRGRRRGGRGRGAGDEPTESPKPAVPSPKDIAQLPRHEADEVVVIPDEFDELDEIGDVAVAIQSAIDPDVEVTPAAAAEVETAAEVVARPADSAGATVDQAADEVAAQAAAQAADDAADGAAATNDRTAVDSAASAEPAAAESPAAESLAAEVDDTPKVVTRTRSRRGASRPVVSTGGGAVVEAAPEPAKGPVAVAAEAPEPPRVVTRTRRGASREVVHTGADAVLSADAAEAVVGEEHIEHVPIKKKGARKR